MARAICRSGVGASFDANKVPGVRACLIHEAFLAHEGGEDNDLNVIRLGWSRGGPCARLGTGQNISRGAIQRRRASSSPVGKSGGFGKQAVNAGRIMAASKRAQVSQPIHGQGKAEVEGFDSLAELALDMRWSWNHATDEAWRQLDSRSRRPRRG